MGVYDDGYNAILSDKTKMSTAALIAGAYGLFNSGGECGTIETGYLVKVDKEDFKEVREMIETLYARHILKEFQK